MSIQPEFLSTDKVYRLIGELRRDVLSEIAGLRKDMETDLKVHQEQHAREEDHRSQRIRWAVTTLITGGLGVISLIAALSDKF